MLQMFYDDLPIWGFVGKVKKLMKSAPDACLLMLQMFYDDLPIWGFIGKVEKLMKSGEKPDLRYYLFTHIHFEILYNANRVIELSVSTDPSKTVDITDGENIIVDYTYSVKWHDTSIPYEKRMDKYSRYSFLPQHLEVSPGYHHLVPGSAARTPLPTVSLPFRRRC